MVTAFVVESYKSLQRQQDDAATQILIQISAQLANLTSNGGISDSTNIPPQQFTPPRYYTEINVMWTLSLIISLTTASMGILLKQWFHEYMARDTHDPKEQVKIRLFRNIGMSRWRVFEVTAFLPLFLQLALLLFFTGLGLYLHQINTIVGWVAVVFVLAWSTIFLLATIMPIFSPQCPYKTPILKPTLSRIRHFVSDLPTNLIRYIRRVIPEQFHAACTFMQQRYDLSHLRARKRRALEEDTISKENSLDIPVILSVWNVMQRENLNITILHCFRDVRTLDLISSIHAFKRNLDDVAQSVFDTPIDTQHTRDLFFTVLSSSERLITDFGENCQSSAFLNLYREVANIMLELYTPGQCGNWPIPTMLVPTLLQLIEAGPTSAAFSILILYAIRHRTITDRPDSFEGILWYPPTEARKHNPTGEDFP